MKILKRTVNSVLQKRIEEEVREYFGAHRME